MIQLYKRVFRVGLVVEKGWRNPTHFALAVDSIGGGPKLFSHPQNVKTPAILKSFKFHTHGMNVFNSFIHFVL